MALMKCPECGREISDTAIQCPHCGKMFGKQYLKQGFKGLGILYSLIFGVMCSLFGFWMVSSPYFGSPTFGAILLIVGVILIIFGVSRIIK